MESSLGPLLPLFERERAAGRALAVGILVHTVGSTYRKPGAMMLIAANGDYAGLLSGGCLEGDLGHHARFVIETGEPQIVSYDTRSEDDLLWGLGLGCEGSMQILLIRVGPEGDWQPLTHLARSLEAYSPTAMAIVVASSGKELPVGSVSLPGGGLTTPGLDPKRLSSDLQSRFQAALTDAVVSGRVSWLEGSSPAWRAFVLPLTLPPRLLLLGAGPDAAPVVDIATRLNWMVTLADHRPAYADPTHFPLADRVLLTPPENLASGLDLKPFAAAVVMSHHLIADLAYLRVLADSAIPYVGLLGPPIRQQKLLSDLGATAARLRNRLHSPVGLPIGGRNPESIALSIVAQIHAFVHGANALRAEVRPL